MNKTVVLGGLGAVAAAVGISALGSGGTCNVASYEAKPEVFMVNGELDYGYILEVTLSMDGSGRDVIVEGTIQTSGGDYSKTLEIGLEDEQTRTVRLQFAEPLFGQAVDNAIVRCD